MPASKSIPAPTLALIVAASMIILYGVDKFLAGQEQRELAMEAHNHYLDGERALQAGKAHEAVSDFSRAHALERSNREYQLALATAQLADHQLPAASGTLADILAEDSNDGRGNLLMARVLAAEGHYKDADSYYHRAIYGTWPADWLREVPRVRLELADMLVQHGSNQELLSEALLLQAAPTEDPATQKKIAELFLKAGSVDHAIDTYRRLIRLNPDDVEAYRGLGRAEILDGNYRAAESSVMAALRRQPYNAQIQSQLRMVARLASLDPTTRRLSTAEKYRRSVEILQLAQAELAACGETVDQAPPEKAPAPATNEMAEAKLDQAESLWKQRNETCKDSPVTDDPLPLLMKKLSR